VAVILIAAVMMYGADVGGMLSGLGALATLGLSLRKPRGKHRKRGDRGRALSYVPTHILLPVPVKCGNRVVCVR
jgi:hypothetical protein